MQGMGGAYTVAALLRLGLTGLVGVLVVVLLIAGTMLRPEKRGRFVLRTVAIYAAGWTLFVLYNTFVLARYFVKIIQ
jgi:hypothetical protein